MKLSQVRLISAPEYLVETGLLGWVSFVLYDSIRIHSVQLRRTADGRLALSFPKKIGRDGTKHPIVKPLNDDVRVWMEDAVFRAIGVDEFTL